MGYNNFYAIVDKDAKGYMVKIDNNDMPLFEHKHEAELFLQKYHRTLSKYNLGIAKVQVELIGGIEC